MKKAKTKNNKSSKIKDIRVLIFSNKKHLKKFIQALIVVAGVAIALLILEFARFNLGENSILYGTKDHYSRNQTLRFTSGLNVKVNDIKLRSYKEPEKPVYSQRDCVPPSDSVRRIYSRIYSRMVDYCDQMYNEDLIFYEHSLKIYNDELNHFQNKNELTVYFEYYNSRNNPINLNDYKIELVANTALGDFDNPVTKCTGLSHNSSFLKGYVEKECISKDIDKGYRGPLALSVTHSGKTKIINLSIPDSISN